jgi:hypothetical protein
MHQGAIRSLGLVEEKLKGSIPKKKSTHRSAREKEEVKCKFSRNDNPWNAEQL